MLDAVLAYTLEAGLAELSLRPLGRAVGASPRTILFHFGSKEELVGEVLDAIRRRSDAILAAWYERSPEGGLRARLLGAWQWLAAPRHERLLRAAFEAHGIALRGRRRYRSFGRGWFSDWHAIFASMLEESGVSRSRAAALATLLVALVRGLLLDLYATGERTRCERAFRSFVDAIELG